MRHFLIELELEAKPHLEQIGARVGVEVVVWKWSGGEVLPAVTFADAGGFVGAVDDITASQQVVYRHKNCNLRAWVAVNKAGGGSGVIDSAVKAVEIDCFREFKVEAKG